MDYLQNGGGLGLLVTDPSETSVQCAGGLGIAKNLTISEKFMSSDATSTNFNGIFGAPWEVVNRSPSGLGQTILAKDLVAGLAARFAGLSSVSRGDVLPSQAEWYTYISTTYELGQADAYSFNFETWLYINNGAGQGSNTVNTITKGANTTLIVQNWGQTAAKNSFNLDQVAGTVPTKPVYACRLKINIRKNAGSTAPQVYYIANASRLA